MSSDLPDPKKVQARVAFEIVNASIVGDGRHKYVVRFDTKEALFEASSQIKRGSAQ